MPSAATYTDTLAEQTAQLALPGGEVAVAGLIWRPLLATGRFKSQTKKLLLQQQCDYFVVHQAGEQAQCGMTAALPSQQRYHSAALLLATRLGSNWVAIFPWRESHFLFIGVQANQIVPGCDVVLPSAAAAIEYFERYQMLMNWQSIYAPTELKLGGTTLDLEALLSECTAQRAYRLHHFYGTHKNTRRLALACGGVLLLLVLAYIGWRYQQHQQMLINQASQRLLQLKKARAAANATQKSRQQQPAASRTTEDILLESWRQQPAAAKMLQQCVETITRYPLRVGGWQVVTAQCTTKGAKADYQRTPPNSPQDFIMAATSHYQNNHRLNSNNLAQIYLPVVVEPRPSAEQPKPLLPFVCAILSKIESGAATGTIDDLLAKPNQHANFELTSSSTPLSLLNNIPLEGVVIHNLNCTISSEGRLTWKISGTVYGP